MDRDREKEGVKSQQQLDFAANEAQSMRQLGLSVHLDFNEFLERQNQVLAVSLLTT